MSEEIIYSVPNKTFKMTRNISGKCTKCEQPSLAIGLLFVLKQVRQSVPIATVFAQTEQWRIIRGHTCAPGPEPAEGRRRSASAARGRASNGQRVALLTLHCPLRAP